jgi:hypothetical protein
MVHVHAKTALTEPVRHRYGSDRVRGRGLGRATRGHVTGRRSARGGEYQGVTVPGVVFGGEPRGEPHGRTTYRPRTYTDSRRNGPEVRD